MPLQVERSVLLVEDDADLCALMQDFFSQHEFRVEPVNDGRRGLARAIDGNFDLILLDVMLPHLDGFEILKQIRRRSAVPIIMLTARTEQHDRIDGLNSGADDYLAKPFGPDELLARMRAVLRRTALTKVSTDSTIETGSLRMNESTREAWCGGEPMELTSLEFEILAYLARAAGRIVSRDELTTVLYQRQSTPYERALDVHVSHLRKKLEKGGPTKIRTVRGVGYSLASGAGPGE